MVESAGRAAPLRPIAPSGAPEPEAPHPAVPEAGLLLAEPPAWPDPPWLAQPWPAPPPAVVARRPGPLDAPDVEDAPEPPPPLVARAAALAREAAQALRRLAYPPVCVACATPAEADWALCPACWRDAGFLGGLVCDACGAGLPGEASGPVLCDDCLRHPRPWSRGRAALPYRGTARALVLALKHADRTDLARPLGLWMAAAAGPLVTGDAVLVPVPLHWTRLLARRHNQAALLARAAGRALGLAVLPDALRRRRRTASLGHGGRAARAEALAGAIVPHPRRGRALRGRVAILVDDVLTTGATLAACARAAREAGAADVRVLVVARAARE